jgi:hypothetical protein
VTVTFRRNNDVETKVVETFEAECTNPLEIQRVGNIQNAVQLRYDNKPRRKRK